MLAGRCHNLPRREHSLRNFARLLQARFVASDSVEGPSKDSISAIAFQVSREEASVAFKEYHKGHFFATKPSSGLEKIKEAFLPFWLARARCSVQLNGARLGFDVWVNRYNPARRRSEPMLETSWQWVRLERAAWEQNYTADDAGMQIYASYKYPRPEVDKLKPGAAASIARKFDGSMVVSDYDKSTRRVGPFQMKPAVALRFAREWISREEQRRAREYLRSSFRCDRVGDMDIHISFSDIRASPVYIPAFVMRSTHFGRKLRTFVSGISSSTVTGSRALDETRVGLVAGVLGGIALIASGLSATLTPLQVWTFGVASPAVVAGFAARYYTHLLGAVREYWSRQEQRRQEAENEDASWEPDWVRAYARLEQESRSRDEREATGNFSFTGRTGDYLGYYAVLGVQPNASKQEIQAAYRGLVMKHHPDRVPEAQKKEASRMFQRVQQAYTVLRDASKRRNYDAGQ